MKRLLFILLFIVALFEGFSRSKNRTRSVEFEFELQQSGHQDKKESSLFAKNLVSQQSNMVAACWVRQFALIERWIAGMRPTVSARAMTYIHLAAYETALPGMPNFVSNQEHIQGLKIPPFVYDTKHINWNIALNACYAKMDSVFLISAGYKWNATITQLKDSLNTVLGKGVSDEDFKASVEWGLKVANTVWEYSKTDVAGNQQRMVPYPKNYICPSGQGHWQGEIYGGFLPFTPNWGEVRTFTTFGEELISPPPLAYSENKESEYYKQHEEVYKNWKQMDSTKRWIAEFWSDDIVNLTFGPSTRMLVIASQMAEKEHFNLEKTLHLFCKLSIGLNDATVACWKSKYIYSTERPWQYIVKNIDSNFKSIMGQSVDQSGKNPPFPAYPSGHSSCAGVSEIILADFFGEQYTFTDSSHYGRKEFMSMPRTFTSIKQLAEEDAYSRIPMGAHVRMDCDEGLRVGRQIGKKVSSYSLQRNLATTNQ